MIVRVSNSPPAFGRKPRRFSSILNSHAFPLILQSPFVSPFGRVSISIGESPVGALFGSPCRLPRGPARGLVPKHEGYLKPAGPALGTPADFWFIASGRLCQMLWNRLLRQGSGSEEQTTWVSPRPT